MGKKSREKRERPAVDAADVQASPQPRAPGPPPWRQVALVAGVALLWRVFYAWLYRDSPFFHSPVVDAQTFHLWAEALREGRPFMPGVFFKPPLYPYLLAFLYDVFGARPEPAYVAQSLLGAGTCVLVLRLGRLVFTPRTALGGALVCALLPVLPFLEFQLLAEPLTTFLVLAAVLILIAGQQRSSRIALAGLLLGIAALGRPNLLILAPVLAWWLWRQRGRRIEPALLLLLTVGLGIAPATLYNIGQGRVVLVSANAGANLWTGIRPGADGVAAIPIGILWDDLQLEAAEAGARDPGTADAWLTRRALAHAAADPLRTLGLLARKTLLLVHAHEGRNNIGADYLARTQGVIVLQRWWPGFWLVGPLALLGLAAVLRPRLFDAPRPSPAVAPALLTLAALALVILPFFVNARFRQPLLPLLSLFAAHGAIVLFGAARGGVRRIAVASGCLVIAAAAVNVSWFDLDRARNDAIDEMHLADILAKGYGGRPPDLQAALRHLAHAAQLDPRNPDVSERRGLYLQSVAYEQLSIAERASLAGRDAGPPLAEARRHLVQAVEEHRRAIDLFPRSFRSHGSVGNAQLLLGQMTGQEATAALAAGDTTSARQRAVSAAGHLEAALLAWQRALDLQPNLPGGRQGLASSRQALAALPDLAPSITAAKERLQ